MSEEKTYIYNFDCVNCQRVNQLKIPFGISVSTFILENTLPVCSHCGCNPLIARSPL